MGFFDKAKSFLGGHGVEVLHTQIEKQDPATARLPIGDTVVKGKFKVAAKKPCTVLSMKASVCFEIKHEDGREETVVLGEDVFPEPNTSRADDMLQYPFDLGGGDEVEDFFIVCMDSDIPTILEEHGRSVDNVRFFVNTVVDVKGSPFDPETSNDISIVS